jgi:prepilin-type N-terminal cleavage/methylation domain-containing protein
MENAQFKMKSAFSLVELLVVIAIICLLFALLFPVIIGVRGNAFRVVCANNLRQVGIICHTFTQDHNGNLPQANSANPATFKFPVGTVLNSYMQDNTIPPDVWYCPTLNNPEITPDKWMSHNTRWNPFNEFPIGYFYVGNPSGFSKFIKPVACNIYTLDRNIEFVFDFCCSYGRPVSTEAKEVEVWWTFPHFSQNRPDGAQVLLSDFSLEYRSVYEMTMGYRFVAPYDVYW